MCVNMYMYVNMYIHLTKYLALYATPIKIIDICVYIYIYILDG